MKDQQESTELTQDEKSLMLQIINTLQVSPTQANALEVITALQSIAKKLT